MFAYLIGMKWSVIVLFCISLISRANGCYICLFLHLRVALLWTFFFFANFFIVLFVFNVSRVVYRF